MQDTLRNIRFDEMAFEIEIGDIWNEIDCNEEVTERLMRIRSRLFHRISLVISTDGKSRALEFLQQFTQNFETKQLRFSIKYEPGLDNALKIMDNFPR
ncbi:hypothetical protein PENTCL1PPCAC_13299, partial [Pristionchus entomophagus]